MDLPEVVQQFAIGLKLADAKRPVALSAAGTRTYKAGIGPHAERDVVTLVLAEAKTSKHPLGEAQQEVAYPGRGRSRCDFVWGHDSAGWAVEAKLYRPIRDNGDAEDTAFKKLASPFAADRSALADAWKLGGSGFPHRKGVLVWAFGHPDYPCDEAIDAFEVLAERFADRRGYRVVRRGHEQVTGLVHSGMNAADVYGYEVLKAK